MTSLYWDVPRVYWNFPQWHHWFCGNHSTSPVSVNTTKEYEWIHEMNPLWIIDMNKNKVKQRTGTYSLCVICIWVRSWNCGCLVTWFCYLLIAKPGNKTAEVSWPDPYTAPISFTSMCKQVFCQSYRYWWPRNNRAVRSSWSPCGGDNRWRYCGGCRGFYNSGHCLCQKKVWMPCIALTEVSFLWISHTKLWHRTGSLGANARGCRPTPSSRWRRTPSSLR